MTHALVEYTTRTEDSRASIHVVTRPVMSQPDDCKTDFLKQMIEFSRFKLAKFLKSPGMHKLWRKNQQIMAKRK